MNDRGEPYFSYLLRLWVVHNQEGATWRCSLEDVRTGKRQGFVDLESLCAFLRQAMAGAPAVDLAAEDRFE